MVFDLLQTHEDFKTLTRWRHPSQLGGPEAIDKGNVLFKDVKLINTL